MAARRRKNPMARLLVLVGRDTESVWGIGDFFVGARPVSPSAIGRARSHSYNRPNGMSMTRRSRRWWMSEDRPSIAANRPTVSDEPLVAPVGAKHGRRFFGEEMTEGGWLQDVDMAAPAKEPLRDLADVADGKGNEQAIGRVVHGEGEVGGGFAHPARDLGREERAYSDVRRFLLALARVEADCGGAREGFG